MKYKGIESKNIIIVYHIYIYSPNVLFTFTSCLNIKRLFYETYTEYTVYEVSDTLFGYNKHITTVYIDYIHMTICQK